MFPHSSDDRKSIYLALYRPDNRPDIFDFYFFGLDEGFDRSECRVIEEADITCIIPPGYDIQRCKF